MNKCFGRDGGVCSDLLEDLRLVLQAAVQVAAGVHAEILHHHLIDQLLQLAQLGAQMSEGRRDSQSVTLQLQFVWFLTVSP